MLLRDRSFNPRFLIVLGTAFLAAANVFLRHPQGGAWLSENAADAVRGFLMGTGIACNGLAVWMIQRHRPNPSA